MATADRSVVIVGGESRYTAKQWALGLSPP
jgi:hypothetical protein